MRKLLHTTLTAIMALVCGTAMAVTVSFDPAADLGSQPSSSTGEDMVSKDGITLSATPKGSFGNGSQYRVYKGSTFKVESSIGNITAISFTCTANDDTQYGPGCFTDVSSGTYSYSGNQGTWSGDASEITMVASVAQVRITAITVTVGAPEPAKLKISGTTPFRGSTTVTITPSNADFAVYYTTDGSDPISNGQNYRAPFTITETTTVKAYEEDYDGNESEVVEMTFVKEESAGATGTGTLDDPFNYVAAANLASTLGDQEVTDQDYYIKGKISNIRFTYSQDYGTATFSISDDGTETDQFLIYATLFLENKPWVSGNTQIKLGDDVIIYGKLTNWKGTYETASRQSYLYSLNGKTKDDAEPVQPAEPTGTGTLDDPFNSVAAANLASTLGDQEVTEQDYYIKGKVSSIRYPFDEDHGTATFSVSDDGNEANQFLIYSTYYLENKSWVDGNTQIALGDDVIICGKITNFKGTYETASKQSYLYSLNGKTSDDTQAPEPTGTGTLEDPFNSIAAANLASTLEDQEVTEQDYYIKGKVSNIKFTFSQNYGTATFSVSDDGKEDNQFLIYSTYFLENKPWVDGNTQIALGDEVIICGKITNFKGTYETASKQSYVYSLNGKTSEDIQTPPEPSGSGTYDDPFNPVAASNLASQLEADTDSEESYYIKGIISSIANNGYFGTAYGNATFYISEDGTELGQFYVFRTLYLGDRKWEEGDTQIKVGDEVIIYGRLTNWKGTTPETKANESHICYLNGAVDGISQATATTPDADAPVYNLAGQRVDAAYKGIVIQAGRKYMQK